MRFSRRKPNQDQELCYLVEVSKPSWLPQHAMRWHLNTESGFLLEKKGGIVSKWHRVAATDRSKEQFLQFQLHLPLQAQARRALDVTMFILSRAHHDKTAFVDVSTGNQLTFTELWRAIDFVAMCLSLLESL